MSYISAAGSADNLWAGTTPHLRTPAFGSAAISNTTDDTCSDVDAMLSLLSSQMSQMDESALSHFLDVPQHMDGVEKDVNHHQPQSSGGLGTENHSVQTFASRPTNADTVGVTNEDQPSDAYSSNECFQEPLTSAINPCLHRRHEKQLSIDFLTMLLKHYFSVTQTQHEFGGSTIEEFRHSVSLRSESRPLQGALLLAMCLVGASVNASSDVRKQVSGMYQCTMDLIDEAINRQQGLLDILKALRIVGKWRVSENDVMGSFKIFNTAISLATACQLHLISSSFHLAQPVEPSANPSSAQRFLGPLTDRRELGERIHTFWGAWANIRGLSCYMGWGSTMDDSVITTPLPKEPKEYTDADSKNIKDFRLCDLYDASFFDSSRMPKFMPAVLLCSIYLLHQAKSLEVFPSHKRMLQASKILQVVQGFESRLPETASIRWTQRPCWDASDIPHIHVCLQSAILWASKYSEDTSTGDILGVKAAQRIAAIVQAWAKQLMMAKYRLEKGLAVQQRLRALSSPYIYTPWFWAVDMLLKQNIDGKDKNNDDDATEDALSIIAALSALKVQASPGTLRLESYLE